MFKISSIGTGLLCVALAIPAVAQQSQKQSAEAERVGEAASVLTEIMSIPENSIPEELMARAHGIAVIPHVVKGAFGIGGQWGKGLMSQRHEDGSWSGGNVREAFGTARAISVDAARALHHPLP